MEGDSNTLRPFTSLSSGVNQLSPERYNSCTVICNHQRIIAAAPLEAGMRQTRMLIIGRRREQQRAVLRSDLEVEVAIQQLQQRCTDVDR